MTSLFDGLPDGMKRRDDALAKLRRYRAVLVRKLEREFLNHLARNGPSTSDPLRAIVPIPKAIDPRVVGAAIRALAERDLIHRVGTEPSRRPVAHHRRIDVWTIVDASKAESWLNANPELIANAEPEGGAS